MSRSLIMKGSRTACVVISEASGKSATTWRNRKTEALSISHDQIATNDAYSDVLRSGAIVNAVTVAKPKHHHAVMQLGAKHSLNTF
jgi:hypothetical protein